MPEKLRVFLADDRGAVRQGLRMRLALEPDMEVVGEASDGRLESPVAALGPDVVVMDVAMPVVDGIEATATLRLRAPRVAVVILTLHDDAATRDRAYAAGAAAFVAKHEPETILLEGIRRAAGKTPGTHRSPSTGSPETP